MGCLNRSLLATITISLPKIPHFSGGRCQETQFCVPDRRSMVVAPTAPFTLPLRFHRRAAHYWLCGNESATTGLLLASGRRNCRPPDCWGCRRSAFGGWSDCRAHSATCRHPEDRRLRVVGCCRSSPQRHCLRTVVELKQPADVGTRRENSVDDPRTVVSGGVDPRAAAGTESGIPAD